MWEGAQVLNNWLCRCMTWPKLLMGLQLLIAAAWRRGSGKVQGMWRSRKHVYRHGSPVLMFVHHLCICYCTRVFVHANRAAHVHVLCSTRICAACMLLRLVHRLMLAAVLMVLNLLISWRQSACKAAELFHYLSGPAS